MKPTWGEPGLEGVGSVPGETPEVGVCGTRAAQAHCGLTGGCDYGEAREGSSLITRRLVKKFGLYSGSARELWKGLQQRRGVIRSAFSKNDCGEVDHRVGGRDQQRLLRVPRQEILWPSKGRGIGDGEK